MPFTLISPCEYREEIRKSRFIALAAPIENAEQALAFVEAASDATASHNCWAWKLGAQYRSSDDGEPGGTAGRPILAAIEAQDCDQVAVLVVRWFGGIPLGTGGLARAYGGCANKCLHQAEKRLLVARQSYRLHCNFSELALVRLRVHEAGGLVEQEQFGANGVDVQLALEARTLGLVQQQLADLSKGRIALQPL
ncbi:IMPACT family protein [Pseudomonas typographi]|uniref:YigZ family protein n=1 Tax=Pseudomonas typographi TaxID=2715964 RepID=A0ABR7Z7Q0_9PSED|nr:YigZ family protein [Pseudomonas typographi]MBD1601485.1 YigZ family protein [Pseudomonas typographi]